MTSLIEEKRRNISMKYATFVDTEMYGVSVCSAEYFAQAIDFFLMT